MDMILVAVLSLRSRMNQLHHHNRHHHQDRFQNRCHSLHRQHHYNQMKSGN